MKIVSFIRNHPILVRIFATLNCMSIATSIGSGVFIFARLDGSVDIYSLLYIIGVGIIFGFIGSIGIWITTTSLLRYKLLVVLLNIPSICLSPLGVFILTGGHKDNIFEKILSIILQCLVVATIILILVCFWNSKSSEHVT